MASGDGTIYFLSPEQLDGSEGVQNAPNLYVVRPGGAPHFVATLESSANAALPPSAHPYLRSFGSFQKPAGVAIDDSTGDVYVLDITTEDSGSGTVQEFEPSGHAVTSFGSHGVLIVPGIHGDGHLPCELAIDQSNGDLYVPNWRGSVQKYSSSGERLSSFEAEAPSGVALDQTNGDLYVSSYYSSEVDVFEASGALIKQFTTIPHPTGLAVNSSTGDIYVVNGGGESGARGSTEIYGPSGNELKTLDANPSFGVAVDPSDNDVYVDEGDQVSEFDSSGELFGSAIGSGLLSSSISLAANSGTLAISNPGYANVALYGPGAVPLDTRTDNSAVIDSVSSPGARNSADFEVTPSGDYAVFPSALPLTGYDNAAHREIYRYDAPVEELRCASCNPTTEQATGEATLAPNGLSLSNDGRVFFNSTEGLVDRDLNELEDVYEWEPKGFELEHEGKPVPGATCEAAAGCLQLISTGSSPFASSLLGISADGTDAYFFTRDKLAEQDENGTSVRIYDARELGGFSYSPPEIQCKASDECHGAGSQAPAAPMIKTIAGTPVGNRGGSGVKRCKAGLVKKHGNCVRVHLRKHRHRRKAHHHG